MTTSHEQGSARIYQFPVKFRATVGGQREEVESAAYFGSQKAPVAACGGGAWYHDEAIRDAERASATSHRFPKR